MIKLELSLKRLQSFIFDVPRLKAMLGANALLAQVIRYELPRLIYERGASLKWPQEALLSTADDPLNSAIDHYGRDDPEGLYQQGILAREGGHFIAVFNKKEDVFALLPDIEACIRRYLPNVSYDYRVTDFLTDEVICQHGTQETEIALLDLPILQVCQETGNQPASSKRHGRYQADSVRHRLEWGEHFYRGQTHDVVGLLKDELYLSQQSSPDDLADLVKGDYLALIHADGNNVGKRYGEWKGLHKDKDIITREALGEQFFHSMRLAMRSAVVEAVKEVFHCDAASTSERPYEVLMLAGDDLLLACSAQYAFDFSLCYSKKLSQKILADGKPLDVAIGVAIAKPKYPFHRLHELAEELAGSAKQYYRALPVEQQTSVLDWQVVTQSSYTGIQEERSKHQTVSYQADNKIETLLLTQRPYALGGKDEMTSLNELDCRAGQLKRNPESARSALRALRESCEQGRISAEYKFQRLPASVQKALAWSGGKLWQGIEHNEQSFYQTLALDVIDMMEIEYLGNKNNGS